MLTESHTQTKLPSPAYKIIPLVIPALIIGIFCSLLLVGISFLANLLEKFWWGYLPQQLNIPAYDSLWIFTVLTLTGVLVAFAVWKMPVHAGPDPATVSLIDKPRTLQVLPRLILTIILMLAGGVV